jgi:hypothetical protein
MHCWLKHLRTIKLGNRGFTQNPSPLIDIRHERGDMPREWFVIKTVAKGPIELTPKLAKVAKRFFGVTTPAGTYDNDAFFPVHHEIHQLNLI